MSKQRQYDLKADELPQFGEGSEYRAREKEIARKMMLGHKVRVIFLAKRKYFAFLSLP